ncbi:MAG TPA: BLUF domain-containing protein [Ramlibacter sp.]|nr:BLUF domain-containing protein [Ramlibacter sp.]
MNTHPPTAIAAETPQVARVIFASRSHIAAPVHEVMEQIRAAAVRNNERLGITTALLHQSGWFIQWKEGPVDALQAVMRRVAGDPRHTGMRIVHASHGPRLLHGLWSMAMVQCKEEAGAIEARMAILAAATQAGQMNSPSQVWQRLCTPPRSGTRAQAASHKPPHQVIVCSAAGAGSFDLVDWLASVHQEPVVRRRLSGPRTPDVESDFVDFPYSGHDLCVTATARRALSLSLTRAFLPQCLPVLLLCEDEARNAALFDRMHQSCGVARQLPTMAAVGLSAAACERLSALAHEHGARLISAEARNGDCKSTWTALWPQLASWIEGVEYRV